MNTLFIDVILASCNLYVLSLKKNIMRRRFMSHGGGRNTKKILC